jgi:hypothetical protein
MRIDQRNAGASVTPNNRLHPRSLVFSKFSDWQINNAAKFYSSRYVSDSMLFTSTSAYTVGASDYFMITQPIEGFNVADLAWGTASAQNVTVSFWVRSSLTGTFRRKPVGNSSATRYYPFSYTVASANT